MRPRSYGPYAAWLGINLRVRLAPVALISWVLSPIAARHLAASDIFSLDNVPGGRLRIAESVDVGAGPSESVCISTQRAFERLRRQPVRISITARFADVSGGR